MMSAERFFTTEGPVNCKKHYCVDPLVRINVSEILGLVDQEKYFVLHAPRQTGKTSCLLALMDYINRQGTYTCLYMNAEKGQSARENVERGMRAVVGDLASRARDFLRDDFPVKHMNSIREEWGEDSLLSELLSQWCRQLDKRLVLFVDEVDTLVGDTLISLLRQIRASYDKRPCYFPQSIILCGVRDVRDYRIHSTREKAVITGGSAFNIKAKSLRLGDFNPEEMETLYRQHSDETGQFFEPDALSLAWSLTQGQPWLVNALAYEVCFEMETGRDRKQPITREMIGDAKETLIRKRATHLDQLADKLQEERVRSVVSQILSGRESPKTIPQDDLQYVTDLGLIKVSSGQIEIANPIYREIIPRQLTYSTQLTISQQTTWYVNSDGRLNIKKLITAFQAFFREHSEHWVERFQYKEAGPQLLMQAFLQRIINSGGRIEREYGLGRMRTDLLVLWPFHEMVQKVVIELKILHKTLEKTISNGLSQTHAYMDRCSASEGHLVVFDRKPDRPWEEKIFVQEEKYGGKKITVWGM